VERGLVSKQRRHRNPRTGDVLPAGSLQRLVVENPGSTTPGLARIAGADPSLLLTLLRELEIARGVRRTGERRGTRWYPYTDEDRIRERAAELEKQTRQAKPITAIRKYAPE
jgi:hypothetical protein